MIINASGRTDICAFYSDWFINRIKEGYLDVRNPFYPNQISRIELNKEKIDAIVFCTKNPIPMMKYLDQLKDYPILFHITITSYHKDIEPYVPPKGLLIKKIKELSTIIGKDNVYLRYDPILLNSKYTIEWHTHYFEELLSKLEKHVSKVIISFIDDKKNVQNHQKELQLQELTDDKINQIAKEFGAIAKKYKVPIQTCAEKYDLTKYEFQKESCLSLNTVYKLTKKAKGWKQNKNREDCQCVETVDIGAYNTCLHQCKYCYANYDETKLKINFKQHDPNSSLIIGHITNKDTIKIRKN